MSFVRFVRTFTNLFTFIIATVRLNFWPFNVLLLLYSTSLLIILVKCSETLLSTEMYKRNHCELYEMVQCNPKTDVCDRCIINYPLLGVSLTYFLFWVASIIGSRILKSKIKNLDFKVKKGLLTNADKKATEILYLITPWTKKIKEVPDRCPFSGTMRLSGSQSSFVKCQSCMANVNKKKAFHSSEWCKFSFPGTSHPHNIERIKTNIKLGYVSECCVGCYHYYVLRGTSSEWGYLLIGPIVTLIVVVLPFYSPNAKSLIVSLAISTYCSIYYFGKCCTQWSTALRYRKLKQLTQPHDMNERVSLLL